MMKSIHHSNSGYTDFENHLFGHGILENQIQAMIQGLSRTMSLFKDFLGLENLGNKKFELMITIRTKALQFRFGSLGENLGVHAKLIYKYQILYLDQRIA